MNAILKFQQNPIITSATKAFLKSAITAVPFLALATLPHLIWIAYADAGSSNNKGVFPLDSAPYGSTYGEWTARWWQWSYSTPESDSPLVDDTGKNCAKNQSGPVWFLAGTGGGAVSRECAVPYGKAILIPIINVECDFATDSSLQTEQELRACAKADQDQVIEKEITVDGIEIQDLDKYRLQSPLFNLTFPENNIAGLKPQTSKAVSDGFWVMLEPLSPGKHEIHFKGVLGSLAATGPTNFALDVKYVLTVVPSSQAMPDRDHNNDNNRPIILQGSSTSGKFKVEVEWNAGDIGKENLFAVKIMDANAEQQLGNATYDIMLFKGDKHLNETHRAHQTAAEQNYTFYEPGDYVLRIANINESGGGEMVNIPISVVPEFPLGVQAIFFTAIFAVILINLKGSILAPKKH